jgi:hypothetical protein
MESTINTERKTMMNKDITIGVICFWIFFLKVSLKPSFFDPLLFLLTVLTPLNCSVYCPGEHILDLSVSIPHPFNALDH